MNKRAKQESTPTMEVPGVRISANELLRPSHQMPFLDPDDSFSRNHSNFLEVEQSLNL